MSGQYDPSQPVIHVRGGYPRRDRNDCAMSEYLAAREWWKAASKDEREQTTIDPLEWEYLSQVEHWSITAQLINAGKVPRDLQQEAHIEKMRAAIASSMRKGMKRIFKYTIDLHDRQSAVFPVGATFVALQLQRDVICLWAIVDPAERQQTRTIYIVGTGHPMPEVAVTHLGTIQQAMFVWHVFINGSHF